MSFRDLMYSGPLSNLDRSKRYSSKASLLYKLKREAKQWWRAGLYNEDRNNRNKERTYYPKRSITIGFLNCSWLKWQWFHLAAFLMSLASSSFFFLVLTSSSRFGIVPVFNQDEKEKSCFNRPIYKCQNITSTWTLKRRLPPSQPISHAGKYVWSTIKNFSFSIEIL